MISRRVAGILLGYATDLAFADPRRGHPVAGFGSASAALERVTYRDSRIAGAVHVALLLIPLTAGAELLRRSAVALAAATWVSLGGTSLTRTGLAIADDLDRDDIIAARELLPSLCGRDPAHLDHAGLTRAALESIAENTSDAQVAPLVWAAVGGVPGVLVYRAVNTLDAMVGHRSPRYMRFGWASARLDDVANWVPARLSGGFIALAAGLSTGQWHRIHDSWYILHRDGDKHPSPNSGQPEAAMAGALGVQLGGRNYYDGVPHDGELLGDGPAEVAPEHIRHASRIMLVTYALGLFFALLSLWVA